MLHLYWGNGKGKTTAAMGLALRALGHGRRVVIVQFLKDGTSGEIAPLRTAGATVYACPNAKFTWLMDENDKAQARAVSADALEKALAQPFELLVLESFQAGLSWECILNKRESFRTAFDGFDCRKVAAYTQEKMDALAADPSIVRNRRKIAAAVNNARIFLTIQEEFGSFSNYLWHFTRGEQVVHRDGLLRASSPLSDAVSRDLKGRGMRFVGSVIIYSYLQAAGIIDDHEPECDFCCGRQRAKEQPLGIE